MYTSEKKKTSRHLKLETANFYLRGSARDFQCGTRAATCLSTKIPFGTCAQSKKSIRVRGRRHNHLRVEAEVGRTSDAIRKLDATHPGYFCSPSVAPPPRHAAAMTRANGHLSVPPSPAAPTRARAGSPATAPATCCLTEQTLAPYVRGGRRRPERPWRARAARRARPPGPPRTP